MQTKVRAMKSVANVEVDLKASEGGILHTLPYQIVFTAKGYGYQAMTTTAVAALVVRPTTAAAAMLWNGEGGSGKVYVIERAFAHWLVSTAAQTYAALWLCVHPTTMAAPTNDITVRNNTRGTAISTTNAYLDAGGTVIDNGWFPWGTQIETSATGVLPGAASIAEIGGRIILPPGAGLSLHVVSGLVGDTFTGGFHWFEVPQSELGLG